MAERLMDTDMLIDELTANLRPVPANAASAVLRKGLLGGGGVAFAAVLLWPSLGVRHDIAPALLTAAFWIKALYTLSIASLGFLALERLSRPDAQRAHWVKMLWPPLSVLLAITAMRWAAAPPGTDVEFWMGASWWQCPLYVAALSVPVFGGLIFALSHLAPTRLAAAGAAAGLVAGATGASIYALHCSEASPGFVLLWYSLGLAAASLAGAVAGPRLLRW
jgi:hypothetical protein